MVQSDEREEGAGIEAEVAPLEEPQKVKGKATKKKKPPAPPPGKFQRFLRKVLLWAVGLLGVFALGVGVTWVMLVRDLRTENADLQSQVEALEAGQVAAQESIRQEYQDQLDAFQAEVEEANLHIHLVNALVDVSSARVALGQSDLVGIRAALAGTDDRLASLQAGLGADGTTAVQALRDQLAALLDDLDQDAISLDQELERITSNLLALERSLFAE